ncbi:MAG TPA: RDD family protein [Acidimicrobiia bacterium]|nr:RDD family protein [Acidimicrobiia bacterium]
MSAHATRMTGRERAHALQDTRAGFVSRVVAAGVDVVIVFALLLVAEAGFAAVRFAIADQPFEYPKLGSAGNSSLLFVLLVIVLTLAWSSSGRTLGNNLVGLRVVRENGGEVSWRRALARALIVVAFHVVAMGWILVSKKNAGIHDLVCRTTVVYDWRARREPAAPARHDSRQAR